MLWSRRGVLLAVLVVCCDLVPMDLWPCTCCDELRFPMFPSTCRLVATLCQWTSGPALAVTSCGFRCFHRCAVLLRHCANGPLVLHLWQPAKPLNRTSILASDAARCSVHQNFKPPWQVVSVRPSLTQVRRNSEGSDSNAHKISGSQKRFFCESLPLFFWPALAGIGRHFGRDF